jgi:hypothetical protein
LQQRAGIGGAVKDIGQAAGGAEQDEAPDAGPCKEADSPPVSPERSHGSLTPHTS